jgi:hypothetical protein
MTPLIIFIYGIGVVAVAATSVVVFVNRRDFFSQQDELA